MKAQRRPASRTPRDGSTTDSSGRQARTREAAHSPRYGSETVVPSPLLLTVNTPVAVSDAYVYAAQPDGGGGIEARNGPADCPWPLVTALVRAARLPLGGRTPMWAP